MLQSYYVYRKIRMSGPYDPKNSFFFQNVDVDAYDKYSHNVRIILDDAQNYMVKELSGNHPGDFFIFLF